MSNGDFVSVILMNINLDITSKTVRIHYNPVLRLKLTILFLINCQHYNDMRYTLLNTAEKIIKIVFVISVMIL